MKHLVVFRVSQLLLNIREDFLNVQVCQRLESCGGLTSSSASRF